MKLINISKILNHNANDMVTVIKKGATKSGIAESIRKAANKRNRKGLMKLAGSLKSDIDLMEVQKKLRDEWE